MAQRKKLQVFVSSTYTDLREERQAAVEAILTAGHIPAGMELFTAGDESQLNVIKRWIDESDIYLLILGTRYGTIEPTSKKSYIHLEYDYAVEHGKALFAIVIDSSVVDSVIRTKGIAAVESSNPQKLNAFRDIVTSKVVKFWQDSRDIKLTVLESLSELSHRSELTGWIPGSEGVDAPGSLDELTRLSKENSELRLLLSKRSNDDIMYHGLTFEQLYKVLNDIPINLDTVQEEILIKASEVCMVFGDNYPSILHLFVLFSAFTEKGISYLNNRGYYNIKERLVTLALVDRIETEFEDRYSISTTGRLFLLRLRAEKPVTEVERLIV